MQISFNEVAENYIKYLFLKDKPQSVIKIKNRLDNHILKYYGEKNIYDFTKQDYIEWQIKINEKDLKYNYKKTLHYCFVSFLNHCVKFYNLNNNVAKIIGNFRNDEIKENGNILNYDEFLKFRENIDNIIHKTFFDFLYFTGARQGETMSLTFNDINNNYITINKTITKELYNGKRLISNPKTKSSNRIICINDFLLNDIMKLKEYYIKKYKNYNNNFYIFGGNKPLAPSTIERYKNKYCKLANVKQIKIHEFRHSHACLLFQNNVPIEDISYRLGHSKLSMTLDVYLKYIPHNEKRVISTLDSLRFSSHN